MCFTVRTKDVLLNESEPSLVLIFQLGLLKGKFHEIWDFIFRSLPICQDFLVFSLCTYGFHIVNFFLVGNLKYFKIRLYVRKLTNLKIFRKLFYYKCSGFLMLYASG